MLPCLLTCPPHPDIGPALNLKVALKKPEPTGDKGTPIFFRAKTSILYCRVGLVPGAGWIFLQGIQIFPDTSIIQLRQSPDCRKGYRDLQWVPPPSLAFTTIFFPAIACQTACLSCGPSVLKNPAPPTAVRLYPTQGSHFWVRTLSYELHPRAHDEGTSQ